MKKIIAVIMAISIVFTLCFVSYAHADALTVTTIAGASYAYGQAAGINWSFVNGNATSAKNWLENEVNSWLSGRSIGEVFGSDVITASVGKLLIPATIAMRIAEFLRNLVSKYNIDTDTELSPGSINGLPIGVGGNGYIRKSSDIKGVGVECEADLVIGEMIRGNTTKPIRFYLNGYMKYRNSVQGSYVTPLGWELSISEQGHVIAKNYFTTGETDPVLHTNIADLGVVQLDSQISASLGENYGYPEFPDVGYNWEGDIGAAPDTNLEQLIGSVYDDVADNNLSVEGEVVNPEVPPTPAPTPVPVEPDTPLQNVPWEGLNDLIGQTGESINEQIQSQTQSMTQAQEATTEAVESLTGTIEGALDVPDTEELPDFKFDLRELFPFCIPFDIYRLLSSFDAEPEAPHVQLPVVIDSINFRYNLDLDFSAWNPVAQAMRTAELIVYAIALAWATGKVIKW